jgi:hypothetical protein
MKLFFVKSSNHFLSASKWSSRLKIILIAGILSFGNSSFAQYNLVPNPGFEQYDTCPQGSTNVRWAIGWSNPLIGSTPDYFNSCNTQFRTYGVPLNYTGYQTPHNGQAYADIITYAQGAQNPVFDTWREYLQSSLIDSLIGGVDYCIRFYVSACDSNAYVSNDIGIYFSRTEIRDSCNYLNHPCRELPYSPQFLNSATNDLNDRTGWISVEGSYLAIGGERYIIIGNFKDTSSTVAINTGWATHLIYIYAQYYIDDVLITPCDSLIDVSEYRNPKGINIYSSIGSNEISVYSESEFINSVIVYSVLGEMVATDKNIEPNHKLTLDISNLRSEFYLITVYTVDNVYVKKYFKPW